jgi:hypothetical protein
MAAIQTIRHALPLHPVVSCTIHGADRYREPGSQGNIEPGRENRMGYDGGEDLSYM